MKDFDCLIIGSGASGLACAVALERLGVGNIAIVTEGLQMGTSINTGSDKQTYYKLGLYGAEPDSVVTLAQDLFAGGAMHGDQALTEAAGSVLGFCNLAALGVPFPHDAFGGFAGYRTDHDPRCRATSCGPYTSKEMCRVLIDEVKRRQIEVFENETAVELLTHQDGDKKRCVGVVTMNPASSDEFTIWRARHVVLACGGPGGLYEASVYPRQQTGAIGLALLAGAAAQNLAESQFGLASTDFRWNVSGSYMQVVPRLVSVDPVTGAEEEFLFAGLANLTSAQIHELVFLKGYQWPFDASRALDGSSQVDLAVYHETVVRGRRVYLDYRSNAVDWDFEALPAEAKEYLKLSGCTQATPFERLKHLNPGAIELYLDHGIDLQSEMLAVAVCNQHSNGGLAADIFGESINVAGLFAIGEVNGSHGVRRPGGTALNSGQVMARQAAEKIAWSVKQNSDRLLSDMEFAVLAQETLKRLSKLSQGCGKSACQHQALRKRMTVYGGFRREQGVIDTAATEARKLFETGETEGYADKQGLVVRQLIMAHWLYLEAIAMQVNSGVGSRGGALVIASDGEIAPENKSFRKQILLTKYNQDMQSIEQYFTECRAIPQQEGWFENIWREYRKGEIYEQL